MNAFFVLFLQRFTRKSVVIVDCGAVLDAVGFCSVHCILQYESTVLPMSSSNISQTSSSHTDVGHLPRTRWCISQPKGKCAPSQKVLCLLPLHNSKEGIMKNLLTVFSHNVKFSDEVGHQMHLFASFNIFRQLLEVRFAHLFAL